MSFNYVSKGNVWPDISDLNRDAFTDVGIGNDHDKPTFNFGNAVALVTETLDFDLPRVTLIDGWSGLLAV